jgi:mannose-6-phosphate isomerase-like protein (cupin superfamily)
METEMRTSDREVITPVDVALDDYWFPRVVGQVNDQLIKVAKLKGENVWHKHDDEDEMFLIVSGSLMMEYEDRTVALKAGDLHVVPRGVMHNPIADEECRIVLIEPASTKHTGDVISEKTRSLQEQMG